MAKRSYTETEKIGTMLLALEQGGPIAEQKTGVPHTTIYSWFKEAGGIDIIRQYAEARSGHSVLSAKAAIANEMIRRVEALGDEQLAGIFREMLKEAAPQLAAAAQAGAQATLQVVIQGTGEVIEVPRDG